MTGPARHAAAAPEAPDPDRPVYAAGIGPGNPAYLTPRARRAIGDADVLIGFETVLERLTHEDEAITRTTLAGLAGSNRSFDDLSVLVVRAQ